MIHQQLSLYPEQPSEDGLGECSFLEYLRGFREFQTETLITGYPADPSVKVYTNEFWTAKQRAASSLQEISYRACFKPQLPRFFISKLTGKGDRVYDPFMGRGTTPLEAALMGRVPIGCDVNPLSKILLTPRLTPPDPGLVTMRLSEILASPLTFTECDLDLSPFYHSETLKHILTLKHYLLQREKAGLLDTVDAWIRMVSTNRLTGHSSGFFSVYTLPPNQAVSLESQIKINEKRKQIPPKREVQAIIEKKTRTLLKKVCPETRQSLHSTISEAQFLTGSSDHTPEISSESISLVVTSPPFLDVINYKQDNWLRCWFNGIDPEEISIWQLRKAEDWMEKMAGVFLELHRVLKKDGYLAFEVGEIKKGKILMEDLVIPTAEKAGFRPEGVIINAQEFTKTANCWGVSNQKKGTNTNRIILLRKV